MIDQNLAASIFKTTHRVSGARQRSGGVEKYSSITSRQAPEHGSKASSSGPDSRICARICAAMFSAQLMQTPARSIPQPVQLQLDLRDVSPTLSLASVQPTKRCLSSRHLFVGVLSNPPQF